MQNAFSLVDQADMVGKLLLQYFMHYVYYYQPEKKEK